MKPDVTGLFTLRHIAKQVYWRISQYSTHQLLQSSTTCTNDVT